MKISLLVETDKQQQEASQDIRKILTEAGYKVTITWPDLEPIIKRLTDLREEIKKIK